MKSSTVIADTARGSRIFLEGIGRASEQYTVGFTDDSILIHFTTAGKRRVVSSKGGVIDLQSKKVTQWARGASTANIEVRDTGTIVITRG